MSNELIIKIRELVQRYNRDKRVEIDDQCDLFAAGVLDSFGMVEFIFALEKEYNIKIKNEDLIPQNFWSISATASTIARYK